VFNFDRWIKRHFTNAGMVVLGGWVAAAIFSADTRQSMAYQLFALLIALLFIAWLSSWLFRIRLTAQRFLPQFATVGEPLHYRIRLYNHTKHWQRSLILLEDIIQTPLSYHTFLQVKEPSHHWRKRVNKYVGYPRWVWLMILSKGAEVKECPIPTLPPAKLPTVPSHLDITLEITPLRRGYIHFNSISFARPDPFGLFNALHRLPLPDKLLVLPKRYPVATLKFAGARKYQQGGINLAISVGDTQEFAALREYRPGDALHHIHWKSFAKLGEPVVKEFQDEFFVRYALILDTFTKQAYGQIFEAAVSVAASLASAPRSHETLLNLMFVGAQAYTFTSGRGVTQTDQLLEILACVQACTDKAFETLYPLVLQHALALSGAMCVFLAWDAAREKLVQDLENLGVPLLVLVLAPEVTTPSVRTKIHFLQLDSLAQQLNRL
jgi:uncharacterized protein (DUF58 family)